MSESIAVLNLGRFCGVEEYPIEAATWEIYGDDTKCLLLRVETGYGTVLHEDTRELQAKPFWELFFAVEGLADSMVSAGFVAEIPDGYDDETGDYLTDFCYCEHETSDKNKMEILERDGDRLLIRVTGETMDVNYYDGSKPNNEIRVQTWFEPA